uniref:Reverse transcriptase domain-containing protein n=1 Tax=Oncorhynchus kisutch TaxID=8019 RepID=A0A8C7DT40_ONCKI
MPLLNVNMSCPFLFWLVFIGLFHCRASSPAHYTLSNLLVPPPTHAMTSPGFNDVSRDNISLFITQYLGLPPLYSHPTIHLSVHYTLMLFYRPQKPPFTLCSRRSRRPILIAFSRTLILLLLCSSGDVEVNPGPAVPSSTPIPQALSFDDFCNRNSLGFMHVNIRSLLPKFVLFTALAHSANPDVLAVSESWLRKTTKNSDILIPNYNIFRQDRTAKGGGVAIYCKDSLQSSVLLSRSVPKQFELLLLKIHLSKNKSLTVAACYRPPSAPSCALDTICELIAPHLSSEFVLLGDLNWNMLNTPAILQSKLDALNLTQIINEPTRYLPKTLNTGTLIDIILTNFPSKYTSAVFNQDLSDHCLIACIRNGSAVKRPPLITVKRSLKHFCEQAFLIDLAGVSWKDIDLIPSVEDAWIFFLNAFLTILNKHAPFKKFRTRNRYSPWFSPDLTALNQHKNILWRSALASNSPRDMQLFREARNHYTQAVRKAKASFFKQKFASCNTNSKKFWDTVKSMENKNTSSQLPTALKIGNTVTTDKSTIIENFNKHFSTAGHAFHLATPTPDNSTAPPTATRPSLPHFSFSQIHSADVLKELQNLDPYKSAGLDNLDPFFLKLSAEIVATPITSLFNLSFVSSEIPKDWKAAAVIPLFKGGDTLDPNCYRPISILPCLSKVFESQVNKQITDHFESHHTFSAMQSGFRAGHGCTSATLKVLNDILTAIDKKHYCAAVFIDLAKAFDSVNHHILIGRLDSLGFSNDCLAWFTNYFSDRVQCVKSEGLLSGPLAVSMGVPQGSILGPTLFSVYINEVCLAAGESLIHLYADDTILYTSGPSLDTVLTTLQASFNAIQLSFRGLQLLLNTSKTKCMLFNRSLPAPTRLSNITTLDGSDLEYVDNYKYLGVWLDCKLSFQTHIKHLQSKVKSRIGFLFRNKASFTHAAKHTLVKLTILPILDFGDVIYKIASNTLLNKLDAVYHSAIRFITKAPYTTHHCDLYALVGWPSLHTRRQTHWLHVIYKTLLGKVPPYLSSLVTIASPTCSTRSSRYISLVTPKTNSFFGRLSFQFSAANDWNELQKSLKLETLISLTSFKHQLSEQLTDYCTCT